jgi:very-short-patch-repair endonuclease
MTAAGLSRIEEQMAQQMLLAKFPAPVREHRFHHTRRWRFDFAWPERMLALEVEGGIWGVGRHTSGAGFEKDCEKYNTATVHGWRVLRVTAGQIKAGKALAFVEMALDI